MELPPLEEAGPQVYRGDIFTHVRTGLGGVVTDVHPGGVVDVDMFRGASLPNNAAGRAAQAIGATAAGNFLVPNTLTIDSIQIRRPAVGTRFELHQLHPNYSGAGEVEVHRVLAHGYLEVVDVEERSLMLRVHATDLYDDAEERQLADPSRWPVVQI